MGLFDELRRRNVFRVAAAYIVLGWLVLQVTDVAIPALRLPDWVPSLVFFLLALGFPFALLLSWAFELTPAGIRRERSADNADLAAVGRAGWFDYALIGLLLAVVVLEIIDIAPTDELASTAALTSIAILPFDNLSEDPEQASFADGLTEELIGAFARIDGLKVAGSVSSRVARDRELDIKQIGEALGVDSVLMGSVRRSGSTLRIAAQLVETGSGFHIWTTSYERQWSDVFDIQDDIARSILVEFEGQIRASGFDSVSATRNAAAYDHYLKGLPLVQQWDHNSLRRAQSHFAAATAEDAEFAPAWAYQALTQIRLSTGSPGDAILAAAETMNRRALAIDPELPEALAVEAVILAEHYQFDEALERNSRAIDARPGYADAYFWRYRILRSIGRIDEADTYLDMAFERDPLNPRIVSTRNMRNGDFTRPRLSAEQLAELAFTLHAVENMLCHIQTTHLAAAYRLTDDPVVAQVGSIWPGVNLKDCSSVVDGPFPVDAQIIGMVACRMDADAIERFNSLAPGEIDKRVVLEWISIAQLRLGQWERALNTLDEAHRGRVPVAGRVAPGGISSNASLALGRVLAHRKLGIEGPAAAAIMGRVRQLVDSFKAGGASRGVLLLEAKLLLLEGDIEAGAEALKNAADNLEFTWDDAWDPILLEYLGERRIRELTVTLDDHIDAERAELGWPPADF